MISFPESPSKASVRVLFVPARNQQMQGRSGQSQSTSAAFGYRHSTKHAAAVGNAPSSAVAGVLLPNLSSPALRHSAMSAVHDDLGKWMKVVEDPHHSTSKFILFHLYHSLFYGHWLNHAEFTQGRLK